MIYSGTRDGASGRLLAVLAVTALSPALAMAQTAANDGPNNGPNNGMAFNISPLRIEMATKDQSTVFRIQNQSEEKLALQARNFAWSQRDGQDEYAPNDDFVISPSIIQINPGKTQTFRLVRRTPPSQGQESSYRVVIDQIPTRPSPESVGAATRLRVTIPFFANGDKAMPAKLLWSVDGSQVTLSNNGARTAKIQKLAVTMAGQDKVVQQNGQRYILPQSTISWAIATKSECAVGNAELAGLVDGKPFRDTVAIHCN